MLANQQKRYPFFLLHDVSGRSRHGKLNFAFCVCRQYFQGTVRLQGSCWYHCNQNKHRKLSWAPETPRGHCLTKKMMPWLRDEKLWLCRPDLDARSHFIALLPRILTDLYMLYDQSTGRKTTECGHTGGMSSLCHHSQQCVSQWITGYLTNRPSIFVTHLRPISVSRLTVCRRWRRTLNGFAWGVLNWCNYIH